MTEHAGDDVGGRFTRLAGPDVVGMINQVPERCRDTEILRRICDLAESLLEPGVPELVSMLAPEAVKTWFEEELNQRRALALVVLAAHADVIRPQDGDVYGVLRPQLLARFRGVFSTGAEAAVRAVDELGGPSIVGIPYWLREALGDTGHTPCEHMMERVALACRQCGPGRRSWCLGATDLGYVLFRVS